MRFRSMWTCAIAVALIAASGTARAADTPQEKKELDKLQGYDSLPGENSVKKEMDAAPNQPLESIIIWSDATPTKGKAPLKVAFKTEKPQKIPNPQYSWSFGDGSFGAGRKVSHTFEKPGVYQVLVKVTNAKGALGEDELRIKVK